MPSKQPRREELEPIERASRDEMQAIQLERLRWSLGHAYRNVPHYKRAFDRAGARLAAPADRLGRVSRGGIDPMPAARRRQQPVVGSQLPIDRDHRVAGDAQPL